LTNQVSHYLSKIFARRSSHPLRHAAFLSWQDVVKQLHTCHFYVVLDTSCGNTIVTEKLADGSTTWVSWSFDDVLLMGKYGNNPNLEVYTSRLWIIHDSGPY
jgi:hypothetical protein